MKILIFECWHNTPQFETGLEIAETHANKGDDVIYVNIGKKMPFLEWHFQKANFKNKIANKIRFNKKTRLAKHVLDERVHFYTDNLLSKKEFIGLRDELVFNNIEELKEYYWNNIDIGMGAVSSLISITNDLDPDTTINKNEIINIIHASKISAVSFEKWLDKVKPDLVYFRNGRVAVYRPIYRICLQRQQKFLIHDRGCNKDHYKISPDLRHNFEMVQNEIISEWDKNPDIKEKEVIADQFYSDRRKGKEQGWKAFLDKQIKSKLPSNWKDSKYNIVFFSTSISEFKAISDNNELSHLFSDQIEAVKYIADIVQDEKDINFHLRLHPNLLNQSENEKQLWFNIKHPAINVISPDSDVDTYAIMDKADLIIVFMSTTGIEAAYNNKPAIQLAKSYYVKLGSTYLPGDLNELKSSIISKSLFPKNNLGAKKYGYYMNTFGDKYKYFIPSSFEVGKFKGLNLQKELFIFKVYRGLKNLFN